MHLCAGLTAASWIMEPSGEIGANFSIQLHREHSLLKLVIKKLSPKINVKNIKKLEFSKECIPKKILISTKTYIVGT